MEREILGRIMPEMGTQKDYSVKHGRFIIILTWLSIIATWTF